MDLKADRSYISDNIRNIAPVISVVLLITIFQILNPDFLAPYSIIALGYRISIFLIASLGVTFTIMMASLDFSVVGVLRVCAVLTAILVPTFGFGVIPMSIAIGLAVGLLNGIIVEKFKVPSFMATLGMAIILEGISLGITKGEIIHIYGGPTNPFRALAVTDLFLPSATWIALALWAITIFIAFYTKFGRFTYAIGANFTAAQVSGINIPRHRIIVFCVSGLFASIAGFMAASQIGGASQLTGTEYLLPIYAAIVLGGTPLSGGVGGPHRTLLGVLICGWLMAGMNMLTVNPNTQIFIFGLIVIGAVVATIERRKITLIK